MFIYVIEDGTIPAHTPGTPVPKIEALPELDIRKWDRVHVSVASGAGRSFSGWIQVTLALPVRQWYLPVGSTTWMEGQHQEVDFRTPTRAGRTSNTLSIPVVAPVLWKVEVANEEPEPATEIYAAVFTQEI
jgi:hypothetical protein